MIERRMTIKLPEDSAVEREVRRRLTWRVILLAASPLPLLLFLIYVLYCFMQMNRASIDDLRQRNVELLRRLYDLEQRIIFNPQESVNGEGPKVGMEVKCPL